MQDYYQILGVPSHASQEEIRSAYRKLVIIYHPDRNPDPSAADRIREINLAYDVVGDPGKRREYDLAGTRSWAREQAAPPPPAHRDPAYRRRRAYTPPKRREPEVSEWMLRYGRFSYAVARVAFVFCVVLVIDAVLPSRTIQEKVIDQTVNGQRRLQGGGHSYYITIVTNYGSRASFESSSPEGFGQDRIVSISRSRMLSIPFHITSSAQVVEKIPATLYRNFVFLPIVLLITSGLGVFFRHNFQLQNSLGVVNAFILFLCLLFYFLFN